MRFIKTPYLQLPEPDGITIMWETDRPGTTRVTVWEAYCPPTGYAALYTPEGEAKTFVGAEGTMHQVKVTGLESGKDYCYQVASEGEERIASEHLVFRTQSQRDGIFSFVITSEAGGAVSAMKHVKHLVRTIAEERPDFLLLDGDMTWDGREKEQWDRFMFTPFRHLFANTPFYFSPGNHDYPLDGPYMKEFMATSETGYYAFTYGCAQFISLNSIALERADLSDPAKVEADPQVRFLIETLEQSTAKWRFVFLHFPLYCSALWERSDLRVLCPIFEKYHVDVVFGSHVVVYERSHPVRNDAYDSKDGVRYLVVGGAGGYSEWFHHKKAWHTAKNHAVAHFAHISVTPDQFEAQAIDIDGNVFDSFVIDKSEGK